MTKVSRIVTAVIGASAVIGCDSSNATLVGKTDGSADAAVRTEDASGDSAHPSEPVGCAAGPDAGGGYNPVIDPANFTTTIDNPYFPVVPGTVQHLTDTAGNVVEITVTAETKTILGVTCRIVHDTVSAPDDAGVLTLAEDTWDWFAQDAAGNVWYFGEDTIRYGDKTGSWTGGVDCAKPGIVMEAHPKVGDTYRQEFYAANAEDQADVLSLNETVTVPAGTFTNCIMTRDYSRLAPGADEHKYYCPGVGNLKTVDLPETLGLHEDLVSIVGSDGGSPEAGTDAGHD